MKISTSIKQNTCKAFRRNWNTRKRHCLIFSISNNFRVTAIPKYFVLKDKTLSLIVKLL